MKTPTPEDARRCFRIRCRSKRGETMSREDSKFCTQMYKKFTEWYGAIEANIFNATVPFGSQAKHPTTLPDPE